VTVGLALAAAVTRLLANFLYGVSPFDVMIFVSVPLLLGLITLLACGLPARRREDLIRCGAEVRMNVSRET